MNERIQELAKLSGGEFWQRIESDGVLNKEAYITFDPPESLEKFARLIVRECANICEDIADPTLYRNADYHSRMSPGASYAAKVIKLRFGVEL